MRGARRSHACWARRARARVPTRLSRDAGRYLCNYVYWRALERRREPACPCSSSMFRRVSQTCAPARRGEEPAPTLAPARACRRSHPAGADCRQPPLHSPDLTACNAVAIAAHSRIGRRSSSAASACRTCEVASTERCYAAAEPALPRLAASRRGGRRELRARDAARRRAPDLARSASMRIISASRPAAPTTRRGAAARHRPGRGRAGAAGSCRRSLSRGRSEPAGRRAAHRRARRHPLVLTRGPSLMSATAPTPVASGLMLDGAGMPLPSAAASCISRTPRGMRIADCEIVASGRHGIMLESCEGEVTGTTITGAADAGIFSLDARGLKHRRQHGARRRQQRHPGLARRRPATTAPWSSTTASRTSPRAPAAPARTATPSTSSAPAMSSCAATASQRRVLGRARQRRLQPADRRQHLHGPRRGRALRRVRLRGRGDRQQRRRRRGARRGR